MLNLRGGTYLLNPNISNRSKPQFIQHLQKKYQEQKKALRVNQSGSHLEQQQEAINRLPQHN